MNQTQILSLEQALPYTYTRDKKRVEELLQKQHELQQGIKTHLQHHSNIAKVLRADLDEVEKELCYFQHERKTFYDTWKREFTPTQK